MSDHPCSHPPAFDPASATALLADFHRFTISLPILRNLITNPGSENVVWTPLLEVRMAKIDTFRKSLHDIIRAYERKSNRTAEDDELTHELREKYAACVQGLFEVVNAHKEALPMNERLAAEAEELRAGGRERLVRAMESSRLAR